MPKASKKPAQKTTTKAAPSKKSNEPVVQALSEVLASTYTLYLKTQNFHWNVVGPWFGQLHPLFGAQYEALGDAIDELAERIRALGYDTPGSFSAFAKLSHIEEAPAEAPRDEEMINILYADHQLLSKLCVGAAELADEIDDIVTEDLLTTRAAEHDKTAWILRSHLE